MFSENERTLREGTRGAAADGDLGCRPAHVLRRSGSLDVTPASGRRRCAGPIQPRDITSGRLLGISAGNSELLSNLRHRRAATLEV